MFTNERYSVKNTKANPDFATEHEVFGYVILMVIFTSLAYYLLVFSTDMYVKLNIYIMFSVAKYLH